MERVFGVLVSTWHILQRHAKLWFRDDIHNVMLACIVLNKMVVENHRYS